MIPDLSLLSDDEAKFIRAVQPIGLDWIQTAKQLSVTYGGKPVPRDLIEVRLPETTALSDEPLEFCFHFGTTLGDTPPDYIRAHFNRYGDGRKNFEALEPQLMKTFGDGERVDTSSSIERRWRLGVFRIELTGWPYDMQSEGTKKQLQFDETKFATVAVTIRSDHNWIYPSVEFDWIGAAAQQNSTNIHKITDAMMHLCLNSYPGCTHRNSLKLSGEIPAGEIVLWRSPDGAYIGASNRSFTVRFPFKEFSKLVLVQLREGDKSPEGSELCLATTPQKPYRQSQAAFLVHDSFHGLDKIAEQLASIWGLPLEIQVTDNF